jgi:hypothetical protein
MCVYNMHTYISTYIIYFIIYTHIPLGKKTYENQLHKSPLSPNRCPHSEDTARAVPNVPVPQPEAIHVPVWWEVIYE